MKHKKFLISDYELRELVAKMVDEKVKFVNSPIRGKEIIAREPQRLMTATDMAREFKMTVGGIRQRIIRFGASPEFTSGGIVLYRVRDIFPPDLK